MLPVGKRLVLGKLAANVNTVSYRIISYSHCRARQYLPIRQVWLALYNQNIVFSILRKHLVIGQFTDSFLCFSMISI